MGRLVRLGVEVEQEAAEAVLVELLEFSPNGVEEVARGEGLIELAVYGSPGELPLLPPLYATAAGRRVAVRTSAVEEGWEHRWKAFHRPVAVALPDASPATVKGRGGRRYRGLHIRPPWEARQAGEGLLELVVDPGMAFGTGAHPSTRLALRLLLAYAAAFPRGPVFDLGCGSGILSLAAHGLGFGPLLGADVDPVALREAKRNASRAGVPLRLLELDLRTDPLPLAEDQLLLANLLRSLLLDLAARPVTLPRAAILGGLLEGEGEAVVKAFWGRGLRLARRLTEQGWEGLLLVRS